MKSKIGIGYSPITNTIYTGKSKDVREGVKMFVGEKTDITEEAVSAVLQHLIGELGDKPNDNGEVPSIRYSINNKILTITMKEEIPETEVKK